MQAGEAGPIASTHLFRFRTFRDAAASLTRDRSRLELTTGMRFGRLVFVGGVKTEGFTLGFADPRLQMAMCVWDSEAALESFIQHSRIARSWLQASDQYFEVRMAPLRSHGPYRGRGPLAGLRSPEVPDGPAALWTFANIPLTSVHYFWGSIRHATRRLLASPGLIAGTAGPERFYRGAMTFTLWHSLDDALRFSYREQPHRDIVERVREHRLLIDSMFIRLRPYAATGSWPAGSRFGHDFERFAHLLEARGRGERLALAP